VVGYDFSIADARRERWSRHFRRLGGWTCRFFKFPIKRTWRELERIGAGWSLPLADPDRFAATIDRMAALVPHRANRITPRARALAESSLQESDAVARMRVMLNGALRCSNEIAWTPR